VTTAAYFFELFSSWCKAITPFLAAIVSYLKVLAKRESGWRFAYGIAGALFLIGIGCYSVYRLIA
jgi:hypothetical protein